MEGPDVVVYPYTFAPIYKEKIWGGRALERLFGRRLPEGATIGESWELADLAGGQSVVADGPDAGKTLRDLLAEKASAVLGPSADLPDGRFPLLLKLLDANEVLSLQVHPDASTAAAMGPPATAKTECWYVLESRGGYILKGVRPGVTEADFRSALAGGDDAEALRRLVRRVEVSAGDFHYLPGGTVHALGAGVVVAEIQTPSETTFRVSDWGRGREIHVAEALRSIHYGPPGPVPGACEDVLVRSGHFAVLRRQAGAGRTEIAGGRCAAWMVLGGEAALRAEAGAAELTPGRTALLPAGAGPMELTVADGLTWLEVTLPQ